MVSSVMVSKGIEYIMEIQKGGVLGPLCTILDQGPDLW